MYRWCTVKNGSKIEDTCERKTGKKLHGSKLLGGKGRLTQSEVDKLQNYYGLAIRRNVNNLEFMKRAVWAVCFHKELNGEGLQHGVCPSGGDSWCKFKNSASSGGVYEHKHSLPAAVMVAIKPVFRDLAGVDPLKKCFHGKTHNPNECVKCVIWTRLYKTVFVRLDTLRFGVYDAVLCFNDGAARKNDVLNVLGMRSG
jgi:hypothetical protein